MSRPFAAISSLTWLFSITLPPRPSVSASFIALSSELMGCMSAAVSTHMDVPWRTVMCIDLSSSSTEPNAASLACA